jgi:hypothetical protein
MRVFPTLLGIVLLFSSAWAQATISAYAEYYVPYAQIQDEKVCLSKQIMEAEFGIPLASVLRGVFAPTNTLISSSAGSSYDNINLLVSGNTRIAHTYNFDRYHNNGVYDYSFTLDLAAFNALHSHSVAGRQKTIDIAKLAIIAIVKTAELTHRPGKFRVWLKFQNVPDQNGLSGLPVFVGGTDWPSWPFTSGSLLYRTYLNEMIPSRCQ